MPVKIKARENPNEKEKKVLQPYGINKKEKEGYIRTSDGSVLHLSDPMLILSKINDKYYHKENCSQYISSFDDLGNPLDISFTYNGHFRKLIRFTNSTAEYYCLYQDLPLSFYEEELSTGHFYHIDVPTKNRYVNNNIVYRKVNNARFNPSGNLRFDYLMGLKSPTNRLSENKPYKFGVELETIKGLLPQYLDEMLNYDAVHDGSLRNENGDLPVGGEYVTGVLYGDTGFLQLKKLCNELTKRCKVNKLCGYHVHIGNANFNNELIVLLYVLYKKLENEMFDMLPKARGKNEYCRRLDDINFEWDNSYLNNMYDYKEFINRSYNKVFNFVGGKAYANDIVPSYINNKSTEHPLGKKCGYNHHSSRYCWINFVPTIFDTRDDKTAKTIEIRNHSGTTNYRKVRNWVLINMGIVWFAENHKVEILTSKNITLSDVMSQAYPRKASILIDYIQQRKQLFSDSDKNNALCVELKDYEEVNEDSNLTLKTLI